MGMVRLSFQIVSDLTAAVPQAWAGHILQACMETYGTSPDVTVGGDVAACVPYIPEHLDYML
jgi:hypothetical protein